MGNFYPILRFVKYIKCRIKKFKKTVDSPATETKGSFRHQTPFSLSKHPDDTGQWNEKKTKETRISWEIAWERLFHMQNVLGFEQKIAQWIVPKYRGNRIHERFN